MTRRAKGVLRWGIALVVVGMAVSLGAIIVFQQWVFDQGDRTPDFAADPDMDEAAIAAAVAGLSGFVILAGLVMIVASLLMQREQIREPTSVGHRTR